MANNLKRVSKVAQRAGRVLFPEDIHDRQGPEILSQSDKLHGASLMTRNIDDDSAIWLSYLSETATALAVSRA